MQPTHEPPYAPPRQKSSSGCLIALLLLGVLVLAIVGVVTLGVYLFATSKEGKQIISIADKGAKAVGEAAKVMEEAARAPGTAELRAVGCEQAFAIEMSKLLRAIDQFDAGIGAGGAPGVALLVICQVSPGAKPPACDVAARAYLAGAGTLPGELGVRVSVMHEQGQRCSGRYAPDGWRLGDYSGIVPDVPPAATP